MFNLKRDNGPGYCNTQVPTNAVFRSFPKRQASVEPGNQIDSTEHSGPIIEEVLSDDELPHKLMLGYDENNLSCRNRSSISSGPLLHSTAKRTHVAESDNNYSLLDIGNISMIKSQTPVSSSNDRGAIVYYDGSNINCSSNKGSQPTIGQKISSQQSDKTFETGVPSHFTFRNIPNSRLHSIEEETPRQRHSKESRVKKLPFEEELECLSLNESANDSVNDSDNFEDESTQRTPKVSFKKPAVPKSTVRRNEARTKIRDLITFKSKAVEKLRTNYLKRRARSNVEERIEIPKATFTRIVKELVQECTTIHQPRLSPEAISAMKYATEDYMVTFFHKVSICTKLRKAVTLMPRDIHAALELMNS
uniref:Histone domain-containing protein n=1 Tax=Rhabditophanes sp. KR3021 TaxID=114890 RepID=A0AC35TLQ3_9BILA